MTAKDKARELVEIYKNYTNEEWVKQLALICVDEILRFIEEADPQALSYEMFGYRDYWREVKEEINKL